MSGVSCRAGVAPTQAISSLAMNDSFKVTLLWIALTLALTLLVMVLSVTGETDSKQRVEIKELKQDKNNLIQELEKTNEKAVAETKKKLKPAPVYVNPLGKEKLVAAVYATFGKDPRILTLIQCESDWNATATGWDGHPWYQYNYGLFQIADVHSYSAAFLYNPYNNIKVAKTLYDSSGWGNWPTCARIAGLV